MKNNTSLRSANEKRSRRRPTANSRVPWPEGGPSMDDVDERFPKRCSLFIPASERVSKVSWQIQSRLKAQLHVPMRLSCVVSKRTQRIWSIHTSRSGDQVELIKTAQSWQTVACVMAEDQGHHEFTKSVGRCCGLPGLKVASVANYQCK